MPRPLRPGRGAVLPEVGGADKERNAIHVGIEHEEQIDV
jgi:hypothetical protein